MSPQAPKAGIFLALDPQASLMVMLLQVSLVRQEGARPRSALDGASKWNLQLATVHNMTPVLNVVPNDGKILARLPRTRSSRPF